MECDVMYCNVMSCNVMSLYVMLCYVMLANNTLLQLFLRYCSGFILEDRTVACGLH